MSVFNSQRRERCNFLGLVSVVKSSASRSVPAPESMWAESALEKTRSTDTGAWHRGRFSLGPEEPLQELLDQQSEANWLLIGVVDKRYNSDSGRCEPSPSSDIRN